MAQWIKICGMTEVPGDGNLGQFEVAGTDVCLANNNGELAAVNNWCPHRQGPLAEGWLEEGKIVCPWHAWGFDLKTGECAEEKSRVVVYALRQTGDDLFIEVP